MQKNQKLEKLLELKQSMWDDVGKGAYYGAKTGQIVAGATPIGYLMINPEVLESSSSGGLTEFLVAVAITPISAGTGYVAGAISGGIIGGVYSVAKNAVTKGPVKTYQALFKSQEKLQKQYQ